MKYFIYLGDEKEAAKLQWAWGRSAPFLRVDEPKKAGRAVFLYIINFARRSSEAAMNGIRCAMRMHALCVKELKKLVRSARKHLARP
jgi:hypothetical protein